MIHVQTIINAPVQDVWKKYNTPGDIQQWNHASPDWYCPKAENELIVGGHFSYTMAARDGSFSFDFEGRFTEIEPEKELAYEISDGRKVIVLFSEVNGITQISTSFEPENTHSIDQQQQGWQAILDNFKQYVESKR
ncbi:MULTISPECIES: SRPBCC domain-containing protein [Chitinophagaceae]